MKKTEIEKRIARTLAKSGWKWMSYSLHGDGVRYVASVPALNHELKSLVVTLDVKGANVCEYFSSVHDAALRISGDERPRAEEIVRMVSENRKPLQYELYTTGYIGIEGRIAWHECYGEWQAAFWSELEEAIGGLDRIAWLVRDYKENRVREAGEKPADDPSRFVTEQELCSWVAGDGYCSELPGDDVILLHDLEDCDERYVERRLTINHEEGRLYWEVWCPNWKLEEKDIDRAIRYANEWNGRHLTVGPVLRVDVPNVRFVWFRHFDFYWVTSEALMRDFGERLIEVDSADRKDVKQVEKEFEGVDVSGLPLFVQEGAGEGTEENEEERHENEQV